MHLGSLSYSSLITSFEQNVDFKVDIKDFWNKGSRDFKGEIAIAHYSADGTFKNIISDVKRYNVYYIEINGNTEAYFKCKISDAIEAGDYLCGVYKYLNPSEWTPIYNGEVGNTQCVEKIVIKEGGTPEPPVETYSVTVKVGEGGKVVCKDATITGNSSVKANKNEKVAFTIVANEGYKIASVLYNQKNVTDALVANVYTTPAITENASLEVTFEEDVPEVVTFDLNIHVGEGGKVVYKNTDITGKSTVQVNKDEAVAFTVLADKGFKISSVLFNDENVTASLVENVYTTPAINAVSTFAVVFEKDETGIEDVEKQVTVYGQNGSIFVKGLDAAMPIVVYAFDGSIVASVEAAGETVQIALQAGQVYIVRVAGRSIKVQL